MAWDRRIDWELNEDEEDESGDSQTWQSGKEAILFLVDCSQTMMKPGEDDNLSPNQLSLKLIREFLNEKCVKNQRDLFGVVFYSTKEKKNNLDVDHVYVYSPVAVPNAELVKSLDDMIDGIYDASEFGSCADYSLTDALWVCAHLFSDVTQKIASKRVLMFTDNDNPHSTDKKQQRSAMQKFQDLLSQTTFELFPMSKEFDSQKFYSDVSKQSTSENDFLVGNPVVSVKDLENLVERHSQAKRSMGSIYFTLGDPELRIGINLYNLVSKTNKPSASNFFTTTLEPVQGFATTLVEKTGETLLPTDIKYFQTYGKKKIVLEKEEVGLLKDFGDAELKLLGFKPISSLKDQHHFKHSQFIYPDEKSVKGGTQMFSALLKRCLERNVMPICSLIPRKNSNPRLVALLAQEEVKEGNLQKIPPGFHVIYLPYSDDIRSFPQEQHPVASEAQIDKAKEVVKALKVEYSPDAVSNPALQKHYNAIEAFALGQKYVKPFVDLTEPEYDEMTRKAGKSLVEFKQLVYPHGEPHETASTKRKGPEGGGAAKKPKEEVTDVNLEELAKNGSLDRFTVVQLKSLASGKEIKISATRKADIIDQITKFFNK